MSVDFRIGQFTNLWGWNLKETTDPAMGDFDLEEVDNWQHDVVTCSDAPGFSGKSNWASVDYGTLMLLLDKEKLFPDQLEFWIETGLQAFFSDFEGKHMPVALTAEHLQLIRRLHSEFNQRNPSVRSFDTITDWCEGYDLSYAKRLFEWLEYWIDYSLKNYSEPQFWWV